MKIVKYLALFRKQHGIDKPTNIKGIEEFFTKLKEGINNRDTLSLIIADYLADIASEIKRKRKVTAREVEDIIALALDGKIMDNESRKNEIGNKGSLISPGIDKYIYSNRREKMDIFFDANFGVSLKTSMPGNMEINMGSFAREALFAGFLTKEEYGGERKGGLGSKPQIRAVFEKIKSKEKWGGFIERFGIMVKNIYEDDMILVIKGGQYLDIFFIPKESLQGVLIGAVNGGPETAVDVINRYEGNSIRVERDKISRVGRRIRLDFSVLKNSKIKKVLSRLEDIEEKTLDSLVSGNVREFEKFIPQAVQLLIADMKSD